MGAESSTQYGQGSSPKGPQHGKTIPAVPLFGPESPGTDVIAVQTSALQPQTNASDYQPPSPTAQDTESSRAEMTFAKRLAIHYNKCRREDGSLKTWRAKDLQNYEYAMGNVWNSVAQTIKDPDSGQSPLYGVVPVFAYRQAYKSAATWANIERFYEVDNRAGPNAGELDSILTLDAACIADALEQIVSRGKLTIGPDESAQRHQQFSGSAHYGPRGQ